MVRQSWPKLDARAAGRFHGAGPSVGAPSAYLQWSGSLTWANSAGARRRRCRYRATFPRSNGFDYDFDSGQCALDFTLHALNLSVQKSCSSWSSDVSPCSPSIELEVKRSSDDLIRSTSVSI